MVSYPCCSQHRPYDLSRPISQQYVIQNLRERLDQFGITVRHLEESLRTDQEHLYDGSLGARSKPPIRASRADIKAHFYV